MEDEGVWVFNGERSHFASGVFLTKEQAEQVIQKHKLSGTLTWYPLGQLAYDWAVAKGLFKRERPEHETSEFIGRFTGGHQHFHYENGG